MAIRARILIAAVAAAILAALCVPSVAQAGETDPIPSPGGGTTGSGFTVRVSIRFSGNAAPGGGGVRQVAVHPTCWWAPAAGPYQDAVAMLAWYDEVTGGQQTRGLVDMYGPRSAWADAAKEAQAGTKLAWYHAYCVDPTDYANYGVGVVQGVDPIEGDPTNWVTFLYRPFGVNEPIPAPQVPPLQLAQAARRAMVIPKPTVDRNPKIHDAGAPTLVGLPTWFWVTNPAAVGGPQGVREIRADLVNSNTWAEVTANTSGLTLDSPGGSANCKPAQALNVYAAGKSDSAGCTVEFTHASVGLPNGYTVNASTDWQATWRGSGATGGQLADLARAAAAQVPVAEVQDIVSH
jgi:hypothetical protein